MRLETFKASARTLSDVKIFEEEPMRRHTSFRIGGPAFFVLPQNETALKAVLTAAKETGLTPLIIGNGTNLLVTDQPLSVPVIGTSALTTAETGAEEITAGAGITLARLAMLAAENSLSGLEFAHGIPGTLGGGVTMNAGAYGGEMRDIVISTAYLDEDLVEKTAVGEAQHFSYRHSAFSSGDKVVLRSVVRLKPGDPAEIRQKMKDLMKRRRTSQPLDMPSAGSTFKRPRDGYAAALIEQAGLKGYTVGGAQVSEKHAGFVVNRGGASFDDVRRVMEHVQSEVRRQFGIALDPEVKIIK